MDNDRKTLIVVTSIVFLIAAVAVFYTVRQSDSLTQFTPLDFHRCGHVAWSLLYTLILLSAAWAAGARLLSLFSLTELTALENIFFSFALGFSLLIASGFAMAALGLYRLEVLIIILIAIFLTCSRFAISRLRKISSSAKAVPAINPPWFRAFAIGVIIVLLMPNFLGTLTPPNTWDELVYHLVIPKTYIEHGGFARLDYLLFFDMPHNINLLYGFSLMGRSAESAHLLHFAFGIMIAGLLIAFSRRFYDEASGWLAALIFLTTPVVLLETRAAMADVAIAFFFCAALYGAFLWWENGRKGFLVFSGITMGIVLGSKYQGLYSFCPLFLLLLFLPPKGEKNFSSRHIRSTLLFTALAAIIVAPWLIKNLLAAGNPIYPNLYRVFDGKDWSPQLTEQLNLWLQSIGMGNGFGDFLLLPWRLTVRGSHFYSRFSGIISPFYFFPIPLLVFVFRRAQITLRLLAVFAIYLVIWFLGSQQMRFLIPAFAVLAIVSGDILAQIFRKRKFVNTNLLLVIVFLFIGLVSISSDLSDVYLTGSYVGQAFGTGNRDDFLTNVRGVDVHPMTVFINESLPDETHVLMLFENRGYYLKRPYIADGAFEASRLVPWFTNSDSPEDTLEILKRRAITHVLVNKTYAADYSGDFVTRFYPDFPVKFENFKSLYLREIKQSGNVVLYEIGN